jgi:hypothetical protein
MVKTLIKVSENIVVLIMHLFYLLQFSGTYCIYSAAISPYKCPKSEGKFLFGIGYWDNQFWLNDSEMKGVLPGGNSVPGGRTGIYFCCQGNRDPNIPMSLPIDQPFYLLAFKSSVCQKVEWATVSPQFILVLFIFCISGCNHTLTYDNETEVEINFPKSQYLDITSQSCSWSISYPSDYIISLNIISLDIPSNKSDHCNTQFRVIYSAPYPVK